MSTSHSFHSKLTSNIIVVLFVALVGVTIYLSVRFQRTAKNEHEIIEQIKLFSSKELDNVIKITLKNKSGDYIFERNKDGEGPAWHMVSPQSVSASSLFIDQLFNSLNVIKTKKLMPETPVNISNFSLNKPTATLTLADDQGKTMIINVGIMNTIDNSTYLKIQGREGIFHVEAPTISLENATMTDLIESRIFALDINQITEIRLSKNNLSNLLLNADKQQTGWISGDTGPLDQSKLEDLFNGLNNIKSSFLLDKPSDAQTKQIQQLTRLPEYVLKISFSDGNHTTFTISDSTTRLVDVDLKGDPYFLIISSAGNVVYVVKQDLITMFDLKAESFKALPQTQKAE
jgi:hypothetical protein